MFSSFDLLLGELIYLVSILSYHRNLMSLFFKKNYLCAVFKVRIVITIQSWLSMGLSEPFLQIEDFLSLSPYGLKWTRTTDLTLIRRAL